MITNKILLFLFLGGDPASTHQNALDNTCVSGAQIIYSWKQLEPHKNVYDFYKIERDLAFLTTHHKKLFIQIQDRSFNPTVFNVPDYIRRDNIYHGGVAKQYDFPGEGQSITTGWVARVWDRSVRVRYQLLLQQLAKKFDGRIYGINLPETAIDLDEKNLPSQYSNERYFNGELENLAAAKRVFRKNIVVQYVNFFPGEWNNDHGYMSRLFDYAMKHDIGLGGPDVIPYRTQQMQNTYPFFNQYQNNLMVAMAIQEPDYTYKNPTTNKPYTFAEFYNFSRDYLGAQIIFWNIEEPFLKEQLIPNLNDQHFKC